MDLDKILKNYKPKDLNVILKPYLSSIILENYEVLTNHNINNMQPNKSYIKYMLMSDALKNNKYETHVKNGGILLSGGIMIDGTYTKISNHAKWTHITIKQNRYDDEPVIFQLSLKKYYIFYKNFSTSNDYRQYFKKIKVEIK